MKRFKDNRQYRLPHWDYRSDGYYFITICTKNRKDFFGKIKNGIIGLSDIGCIAAKFWQEIPRHFNNVELGTWVIMPNHIHGIIVINNSIKPSVGPRDLAGLQARLNKNRFGPLISNSLSSIIHGFKSSVKRFCNKNGNQNFAWQSRYWDRVIRNEEELMKIHKYIEFNPHKWDWDRNHPDNTWIC